MRHLLVLGLILICGELIALPAGREIGGRKISTINRLIGHWHSTSLSGDGIGLAVDNVVVEFKDSKHFIATVNMNLGGPNIYKGVYDAKHERLILHTETNGKIPCRITFNGRKEVTVEPTQESITVVFKRGKPTESSGGFF